MPRRLLTLTGPIRSMWSNSSGLEVDTCFLYLNDVFVCFPFWQASQMVSCSNLKLGMPITKSFLTSFSNWVKFTWANRLCQSQQFSSFEIRHFSSRFWDNSRVYRFPFMFSFSLQLRVFLSKFSFCLLYILHIYWFTIINYKN